MTPLRYRRARVLALSCSIAVGAAVAFAAPAGGAGPGDLDPHFGDQGKVVGKHAAGDQIVLLPNGGFVGAGFAGKKLWVVTEWTAKGKSNTSFGGGDGVATFSFPGTTGGGADFVAVRPNGKIVVSGDACGAQDCDFGIAQLTPTGKLDHHFGGGDGRVAVDFLGDQDLIDGMVLRPSGKVAVDGNVRAPGGDFQLGIVQLKKKGGLDASFGTGGKVITQPASQAFWESLALQPNGRLVAGGSGIGSSGTFDIILAGFQANGTADSSFGTNGLAQADFDHNSDVADQVVVLSDGSLLAAGVAGTALPQGGGTDDEFGIVKFDTAGNVDTSFGGGDGWATANFDVPGFDRIFALAVQSDGKIVAAGGTDLLGSGNREWVLARYNPDGSSDTGFGTNGVSMTNFTPKDDEPSFSGLIVEPKTGRIVGSGFAGNAPALAGYIG